MGTYMVEQFGNVYEANTKMKKNCDAHITYQHQSTYFCGTIDMFLNIQSSVQPYIQWVSGDRDNGGSLSIQSKWEDTAYKPLGRCVKSAPYKYARTPFLSKIVHV